ncbi:GNAT family N-acetyltransferase [Candidatus Sulfidibacterium hydrothermale]|uniref:GNAT family N-acetyltransferase n=1 Tax=Candidatus Sulfidibacterium hydrothermale TaxID=2875962 RepID=UPI001F0B6DA0|nr:GNAT family N-acetyltransferase [Candidatus Sulfidibacterium hydrothermale]UBM63428.1 GNAT family N-acetyltransferase [Candidatus Sulfidibacterium hydrothermale]
MENVVIKEVKSKADLKKFIAFPDKLYKGNKYRVPQLHMFEKATLSPKKNPAFDFCEARYWLAYKDNKIVGRIAAIINHKSNEIWNEKHMRFGWIDFIDDIEVSKALIQAVENWAKEKGMEAVHGPLGFSDMDLEGMLVEGFNEIGTQATLYNYPYYPEHLEKLGYVKDVDWIQFEIKVPDKVPDKIKRISSLVLQKYNLHVLEVKKAKEFLPYAKKMFHTLNEAFQSLYGFVPLTEKQIEKYTKDYFSAIDPRFVCFVLDKDDDVVGFGISLYSLSEALQKAKGKLFPFGFIHILKALKKNDKVDMLLQAVKPQYQNKGIPAVFYSEMMQAYIDNGVKTAISSHALEDNKSAFLMFKDYELRQHLKRRCYIKKGI